MTHSVLPIADRLRKSKGVRGLWLIPVLAVALVATACSSSKSGGGSGGGDAGGGSGQNITLGIYSLASGPSAPYTYAVDKGIFKKHGLNVTLQFVGSSSNTTTLLEAGKVDVALTAASSIISASGKGAPLTMFMGEFQKEADGFIFPTSENIKTIHDLKGKKVAINPAASGATLMPAVLAKAGMSESDLNIQKATQAALHSIYAAHQADAVVANPYSLIPSFDKAGIPSSQILFSDFIDFLGVGFVIQTRNLQKDATMIKNFVAAVREAFQDSMADPKAAVASLIKMKGKAAAPDEQVAVTQLTNGFTYLHTKNTANDPIGVMSVEDWKSAIALSAKYNNTSPSIDPNTLFTNKFVSQG